MVMPLPSALCICHRIGRCYTKGDIIALPHQLIDFPVNPGRTMSPSLLSRNSSRTKQVVFSRSRRRFGSRRTRWNFPQFLEFVASSCKMLSDVSDVLVEEFVPTGEDNFIQGFGMWNLLKRWKSFRRKQRRRRNQRLLWNRLRFVLWVCFCFISFGRGLSQQAVLGLLGFVFLAAVALIRGNGRSSNEWIIGIVILGAVFILSDKKADMSKWVWKISRSPTVELLLKFKKENW